MITSQIKDDIKGSRGMPVSVSVVGLPWEDEIVLGVMKSLSEQIQPVNLPIVEA